MLLWLLVVIAGLSLGVLSEVARTYGGTKAAVSVAIVAAAAALAIWWPQRRTTG